jgi:hypothetical protein
MEAGVDLDAVKTVGVALKVREFGVAGGRESGGVFFGERPTGGTNVEVVGWGRVGGVGVHGLDA